jgi:ribonuclease H2 subunit A
MNILNKKVYVDTVGKPEIYQTKFEKEFERYDIKFTVTTKADSKFPVVSAASIVAKVNRDRIIENWMFEENFYKGSHSKDFGSGYPGDPKTKQWIRKALDKVFGFPTLVRYSWKTATKLLKDYFYKAKWFITR